MRMLLDTCTLSEMRKENIHPRLKELLEPTDEKDLFISVVSLGELVKGVCLLDESRRKQELMAWINGLEKNFAERLLTVDVETAHIWGELTAKAQKSGKALSACDGLIAATALKYGLHIVTRNSADFVCANVLVLNPWSEN